ncbi:MAG: hypothetical protein VR64_22490 [Desulfatitalea sp. BRH_c12]|nr:MAG: hypothetical protein VR64_22490 [Desulfatitalea sp. BRH_c12]
MTSAAKTTLFCLVAGMIGTFAGALPIALTFEEDLGLHLLFRLRGPASPPGDVVIVSIAQDSAYHLNLPVSVDQWPRKMHARLIERLNAAGAAFIAIDIVFNEHQTPENDLAFARAIATANNVILAQALAHERITLTDSQGRQTGRLNIEKVVSAIPSLCEAALAEAPFPLPKIPISLRQYWTFKPGAGDIMTLPVVAFHVYAQPAYRLFTRLLLVERPHLATLFVKDFEEQAFDQMIQNASVLRSLFQKDPRLADRLHKALDDPSGRFSESAHLHHQIKSFIDLYSGDNSRYLNFYGPPDTLPTIPYHEMIDPPHTPASEKNTPDLEGKVVFVGLKESTWGQPKDGFHTVFSTPDGTDISGVEIAATAFANLLEHNPVQPLSPAAHMGVVMAWGTFIALICVRLSFYLSTPVLMVLCGVYTWGALRLFASEGLWLPLAVPLGVQVPVTYFGMLIGKYHRLNRERQNIRSAFGHYLPDAVVDQLAQNISHLHDDRVLYSICLFTDAEKYTSLSETMDPLALTHFMNDYYESVFKPIKDNGGIVLQVVGDSVLAIWTSPLPDSRLRMKACQAALGIAEAMQGPHEAPCTPKCQLPTRIGLHAGYIVLGNIGAMDHFEYRPVGDIVNTASRLEGLNKYLGTRILVSAEILEHANGFLARDVGRFVFTGKSKAISVYELVAPAGVCAAKQVLACDCFAEGLRAFRMRSWNEARRQFAEVINLLGADGPSAFYLNMCDAYKQSPPGAEWDGTIALNQK